MSIGSLSENIKMDLEKNGSYDRYPVRFLSVRYDEKTSDTLMQLKKQLAGWSYSILERYCPMRMDG